LAAWTVPSPPNAAAAPSATIATPKPIRAHLVKMCLLVLASVRIKLNELQIPPYQEKRKERSQYRLRSPTIRSLFYFTLPSFPSTRWFMGQAASA
jgi:hypothetical protein